MVAQASLLFLQWFTAAAQFLTTDETPPMTPPEFLIISSPTEQKVVYTELVNMHSVQGRTYPLIDSGLVEPVGIAFDRERGDLYVADRAARMIFRYSIMVSDMPNALDGNNRTSLLSDGIRLTVMEGRNVSWVTLNQNGDIFYSDEGGKTINKITVEVMEAVAAGDFEAKELIVVPERELEASASAAISTAMATDGQLSTEPVAVLPHILSLYDSSINPHVSSPAGLVSDGLRLYWANGVDGETAGLAVKGEVNPKAPLTLSEGNEPAPFPASIVMQEANNGYGVALSNTFCFVSSARNGAGAVYGTRLAGGPTYAFATGLGEPRGLVWDGDNTVYVADTAASTVMSFPVGRMIENAPLTKAVDMNGAWGITFLSSHDPAFQIRDAAMRQGAVVALFVAIANLLAQ